MTTPDPTLATRLAGQLQRLTDNPSIPNFDMLHQSLYDALRSSQLITIADAEAMVRAENEACAKIARGLRDQWRCANGFEGFATGAKIIDDAIRARVKP